MIPIIAKGSFHDVGRTIGERTSEKIRFQERHLVPAILRDGFGGDELGMRRASRRQQDSTEEFWPDAAELLEGMAKGAGMRLDALLPVTYCEEIAVGPSADAMREKCSTLVIRTDEGWVVGHQEDYLPIFEDALEVYDLRLNGYPRMVSLNYPGTFPGVAGSLNAEGVATTNNSLWPDAQRGISKQAKHFRATLEDTVFGALAWLAFPPVALTDHFTVLGGEEDMALSLEVTDHPDAPVKCEIREIVHDRPAEADVSVEAPFWHANHVRWLEPWVSGAVRDPANRSSALRGRRLREICENGAPRSLDDLTHLLIRPDGILNRRQGNDRTGAPFTVTLATTLIDPSSRRIRFFRYGGKGTTCLDLRL